MNVCVFMWVHVFVDAGGGQKSALGGISSSFFRSYLLSMRQGSSLTWGSPIS